MSVLKKSPDYVVEGGAAPDPANAYELWVQNDAALRDLTYGPTRTIEGAVTPHNHGHDGGEILDEVLASVIFGPQASETAGGTPTIGVPYGIRATADFLFDDGSSKLLGAFPLLIPGGVSAIDVTLVMQYNNTSSSLRYHVQLVPFQRTNTRSQADGVTGVSSLVSSGSTGYKRTTVDITDLSALGDPTQDRLVECRIFQALSSTILHRFCSVLVTVNDTTGGRAAMSGDPPRARVTVSDLLFGAITPELTARMKRIENGHAVSLLGRAPGLHKNGTPDRNRDYEQRIYYPHQHQGQYCPDSDGAIYSDGACLRRPLWISSYSRNLGDDGAGNVDALGVRGVKIHPSGTLSSTWLHHKHYITIPAGLGAFELYFAIQPATTDAKAEMRVHIDVRPVGNPVTAASVVAGIRTGRGFQAPSTKDSNGYFVCEVEPQDGDAFQFNKGRIRQGKGLWTLDAQLSAAETQSGIMRDNPARISQVVYVFLQQKALRAADTFRETGDCIVFVRYELRTIDSGNYDASARLLWDGAFPQRGW